MDPERQIAHDPSDVDVAGIPDDDTASVGFMSGVRAKAGSRNFWMGDTSYLVTMCSVPLNPWGKKARSKKPIFVGKDEHLPVLVLLIMGFQHAASMVSGIILSPILVGLMDPTPDRVYQRAIVSSSLIINGISTIIQSSRIPIWRTPFGIGSGLLSVMGSSSMYIPIVAFAISLQTPEGEEVDFPAAYGSCLGVFMLGGVFEMVISMVPRKTIRKMFPPAVSGVALLLLGINLIDIAIGQWGGGVACADKGFPCRVGETRMPYGSPEYMGIGLFTALVLLACEIFGSPFVRSCQFIIALFAGFLLAAVTTDSQGNSYTSGNVIEAAPVFTFLWTTPIPYGFYTPALLPVLISVLVTTLETIGDITATAEISKLDIKSDEGKDNLSRFVQGGLMGDGFNTILAAFAYVTPNTTYGKNNGIIAMTGVASRWVGICCGVWLFLFGIFGKLGAFLASVPDPVLGGVSAVAFMLISMGGVKVLCSEPITRRVQFIAAMGMAFGIGVTVRPEWVQLLFPCGSLAGQDALQGLCLGAKASVSNGFALGSVVALICHGILPGDFLESEDGEGRDDLNSSNASGSSASYVQKQGDMKPSASTLISEPSTRLGVPPSEIEP